MRVDDINGQWDKSWELMEGKQKVKVVLVEVTKQEIQLASRNMNYHSIIATNTNKKTK